MKVVTDTTKCCSSGMCVLRAPQVFGQDEETGLVRVLTAQPPEDLRAVVAAAVEGCPVRAITLVD